MTTHIGPTRLSASTKLPASRGLDERRKLGAFYTPEPLSRLLANWTIRSTHDLVLEPSFGGCGFLTAARDVLTTLGALNPAGQMYGCDIDPQAFTYLSSVFDESEDSSGFVKNDFLDCRSLTNWPDKFTAVLANPPYIPHHRIGRERVRELSSRAWSIPDVGGRSSLWAYFICQSIDMLAVGGRMAWVLPGAFLQADYARPIKNYLSRRFERVAAIIVRDRLFLEEGTDEETVILLAEGHRNSDHNGKIVLGEAQTINELAHIMSAWGNSEWLGDDSGASPATLSMTEESLKAFEHFEADSACVEFGEVASVRIGIVTGANDFFVLNKEQLRDAELLEEDCELVLSKFRAAVGAQLLQGDLDSYAEGKGKIFLVTSKPEGTPDRVLAYLATFDEKRKSGVSTFRKRSDWSRTSDGIMPDAFFPVMHHTGPRLVLNGLGCNCTNTIHRVFFSNGISNTRRMVAAISFLTSFTQISAELVGRRYGSGVLKHEPRDAEKIKLLVPEADETVTKKCFLTIDRLLRAGQSEQARATADKFIADACGLPLLHQKSEELGEVLRVMRARRTPNRSMSP